MGSNEIGIYDVVIAGAGPAGSTCARECARQGLKTLLLDKDRFPRSKPCGGALSGRALSYLGVPLPRHVVEQECFGARVHYGGRIVEARKSRPVAVLVDRLKFDALLADKAVESGARFLQGEQVEDVRLEPDGVAVITKTATYRARYLIGADGVHSRVGSFIRPSFRNEELDLAMVSHVPAGAAGTGQSAGTVDLYFGTAPLGYGWRFPCGNYSSVGMTGLASRFARPRESLADLARVLDVALPAVRGHFIPLGGMERTFTVGRILLVGDAAGFADPFYGEGITYAILSGQLAARAILEAQRRETPSAAAPQYRRNAEQRIVRPLRIALRMANLLERHPRLFLRIFFDHPEALSRYLDVTAGAISYRYFQWWVLARLPFLLTGGKKNIVNAQKGPGFMLRS